MQRRSFTIVEILIVISIIALLAVISIAVFNPFAQIEKSLDTRRKTDLELLNKAFEDYYNDKGCYPKPEEVCYDSNNLINICPKTGSWSNINVNSQVCHICGNESAPPSYSVLSPYIPKLPCDPEHSRKQYLYEIQANSAIKCNQTSDAAKSSCPQWYGIYSIFSNKKDKNSGDLNCTYGGCGIGYDSDLRIEMRPSGTINPYPLGYDFGVASPNRKVQTTDRYACSDSANNCNYCGSSYDQCAHPENYGLPYPNGCISIFPSRPTCCLAFPGKYPGGC